MKSGTKKLIVRTLKDRVEQYERSIQYCEMRENRDERHIQKLNAKVEKLNIAIKELQEL